MSIQKLTVRLVENLKPAPNGKQVDYWDTVTNGFGVRVSPSGKKTWFIRYRTGERKRRRVTLGAFPGVSMADARAAALNISGKHSQGIDYVEEQEAAAIAEKEKKRAMEWKAEATFAWLAGQYLEHHAKVKKRSWVKDHRCIEKELLPAFGERYVGDIRRRDIRTVLEKIRTRGAPIMANRCLEIVRKVFNWGVQNWEEVEANPAAGIPRPSPERPRDRVLTDEEIRAIWKSIDEEAEATTRAAFRLRLVTAQREVEILSMAWNDIDGDWWTVRADVAKNKKSHRVPLSDMAKGIIQEVKDMGHDSPWVFPSPIFRGKNHITNLGKAAGRIRARAEIDFKPHDFRRTAASLMTGAGIPRLTVSRILNHAEGGVTAVYDRHSYDPEKRQALELWAVKLQGIINGEKADNVVRLHG